MFNTEPILKLFAMLFAITALSACATIQEYWTDDQKVALSPKTYTVNKGDTLYSIAWLYELDYRRLAQWNDIKAPNYLIYPGQQLRLDIPEPATEPEPESESEPEPESESEPEAKQTAAKTSRLSEWQWPLNKPEVKALSGSNALLMKGKPSEAVRATAAGVVVYSGFNLKHYDGLIIIKHDGDIFSVYGNNKVLLVVERERVAVGQEIARLPASQADANLYFEIKHRNKSLKAVNYLPALKIGLLEKYFMHRRGGRTYKSAPTGGLGNYVAHSDWIFATPAFFQQPKISTR